MISERLYRFLTVLLVVLVGTQWNIDTLDAATTWFALSISAVGAYIIAVNLPIWIETKLAEFAAYREALGL